MTTMKKGRPKDKEIRTWVDEIEKNGANYPTVAAFAKSVGRAATSVKRWLPAEALAKLGGSTTEADESAPVEPPVKETTQAVIGTTEEATTEPPTDPEGSPADESLCPRCGDPLSFVEKFGREYCYNCREYAPVEPPPSEEAPRRARRFTPADMVRDETRYLDEVSSEMVQTLIAIGYEKRARFITQKWANPPFPSAMSDPVWLKIILERYGLPPNKVRSTIESWFGELNPDEVNKVLIETTEEFYTRHGGEESVTPLPTPTGRPHIIPHRPGMRPPVSKTGNPVLDSMLAEEEDGTETAKELARTKVEERQLALEERRQRLSGNQRGHFEELLIELLREKKGADPADAFEKALRMVEARGTNTNGEVDRLTSRLESLEERHQKEQAALKEELERTRQRFWEEKQAQLLERVDEMAQRPDPLTSLVESLGKMKQLETNVPGLSFGIGGASGDIELIKLQLKDALYQRAQNDLSPLIGSYLVNQMRIQNIQILKQMLPDASIEQILALLGPTTELPRRQPQQPSQQQIPEGADSMPPVLSARECLGCGAIGKRGFYNDDTGEGYCNDCFGRDRDGPVPAPVPMDDDYKLGSHDVEENDGLPPPPEDGAEPPVQEVPTEEVADTSPATEPEPTPAPKKRAHKRRK